MAYDAAASILHDVETFEVVAQDLGRVMFGYFLIHPTELIILSESFDVRNNVRVRLLVATVSGYSLEGSTTSWHFC